MLETVAAVVVILVSVVRPKWTSFVVLTVVIFFDQELYAGNTESEIDSLLAIGPTVYYGHALGPLSIGASLVVAIVCTQATRYLATPARRIVILSSALAAWALLLGFLQGSGLQEVAEGVFHVVALLAGVLAGASISLASPSVTSSRFSRFLYVLVFAKVVQGAFILLSGRGFSGDGTGIPTAFYDSAPLIIAAATFIAALLDLESSTAWRAFGLLSAAALLAMSLRRASLVGGALALVVALMVARRWAVGGRALLALGLVGGAALIVEPSLGATVNASIQGALEGILGGGDGDSSTSGHVHDNIEGLRLALEHPWLGVGVTAPPTDDFVVTQGAFLYVHNELLYAWLHFGIIGLVLLSMILVYSGVVSIRALSRWRKVASWELFGSGILVAAVPGYLFFPHVLTLERFGLLIGWSLGAVAVASGRRLDVVTEGASKKPRGSAQVSLSEGRWRAPSTDIDC